MKTSLSRLRKANASRASLFRRMSRRARAWMRQMSRDAGERRRRFHGSENGAGRGDVTSSIARPTEAAFCFIEQ
jgi:hypothetical protein